jgi:hypothetical protein
MIKSVWRPKFENVNNVKIINRYDMSDIDVLLSEQKKGWIVIFECDVCKINKPHSTTSHVFFNSKNKYNTKEHQTCRSCRSKISEYDIKKNYIPFDKVKKLIVGSEYKLLTNEEEYMSTSNRSQLKLNIICNNNHELTTTWNNWVKGKRCRECYENNKFENAVKNKNGWGRFKFLVWYYSEKSYKEHYHLINKNNNVRGSEYHLDHRYSLYEGFINNVSPKIIGGYKNLEIIEKYKNLSKGKKCSINLNEIST